MLHVEASLVFGFVHRCLVWFSTFDGYLLGARAPSIALGARTLLGGWSQAGFDNLDLFHGVSAEKVVDSVKVWRYLADVVFLFVRLVEQQPGRVVKLHRVGPICKHDHDVFDGRHQIRSRQR